MSQHQDTKHSHFFAYISRLKLIYRWPLMRSVNRENVQEHSHQAAVLAHCLAVIKNRKFGGNVNADRIAVAALYHDASEVLTGDLPTPVKYFNSEIAQVYKSIEQVAERKLLAMLPDDIRDLFEPLLTQNDLTAEERAIIKAADTLCAYIKTIEEIHAGNHEFDTASQRLAQVLAEQSSPEIRYFIEVFIPSYSLNLDQITADEEKQPLATIKGSLDNPIHGDKITK